MIVTGALFADAAVYTHGKLNVLGGLWDTYTLPARPGPVEIVLVTLVQFEPDDNLDALPVAVEVTDPDGTTVVTVDISAAVPGGNVLGSMVLPLEIEFGRIGRHAFLISSSSGGPISVPLDVRPPPHPA